jgi:hypothetical protein
MISDMTIKRDVLRSRRTGAKIQQKKLKWRYFLCFRNPVAIHRMLHPRSTGPIPIYRNGSNLPVHGFMYAALRTGQTTEAMIARRMRPENIETASENDMSDPFLD